MELQAWKKDKLDEEDSICVIMTGRRKSEDSVISEKRDQQPSMPYKRRRLAPSSREAAIRVFWIQDKRKRENAKNTKEAELRKKPGVASKIEEKTTYR